MTCTYSKETHCDCVQQTHNMGDHTHGEKPNTTRKADRLRFFIPKHTHHFNGGRLQEKLDDGTWVDVPLVYEDW